jgi:hypothetical protein
LVESAALLGALGLPPMSCCTLKFRSYCSMTWERPDSTRMVCAEVKSLCQIGVEKKRAAWSVKTASSRKHMHSYDPL